jgi:hypothetical protein
MMPLETFGVWVAEAGDVPTFAHPPFAPRMRTEAHVVVKFGPSREDRTETLSVERDLTANWARTYHVFWSPRRRSR